MQAKSIIYIVDDDKAVCHSLKLLMKSAQLFAKTFTSAHEFLAKYDHSNPGCLILDMRMPGMDGLELQALLNKQKVPFPIIKQCLQF